MSPLFSPLIALLLGFGSSSPILVANYTVKSATSCPGNWVRVAPAPSEQLVTVRIGLRQQSFQELEWHLLEVSDPSHARYGRYLSTVEVDRLSRPSAISIDAVTTWLREKLPPGQDFNRSVSGDWISLPLSFATLGRLLNTDYGVFQHTDGATIVRCLSWSLPTELVDYIDWIEPSNAFPSMEAQSRYDGLPPPEWDVQHRMPTYEELVIEDRLNRGHIDVPSAHQLPDQPTVLDACNRLAISPLCLSVLYGTWNYTQRMPEQNSIALVNFLGEINNRSDIDRFLQRYNTAAADAKAAYNFITEIVDGGEDQQSQLNPEQLQKHKGFEGALDAQTILALSWPIPLTAYNVGSKPPFRAIPGVIENCNEPYLTWLEHLLAQEKLPYVVSISYAEDEKTVPPEYAHRVCKEFAKLAARGVSVLVASGDWGVGKTEQCFSRKDEKQMRFAPSFPASCPYVTSVGATRFLEPETVGFDGRGSFSSGGGFSELFEQPYYQRAAVNRYLNSLGNQHAGFYNPKGRGIPDVAAMGYHFSVMWNGTAHLQDGTSASAPTMASIIALVNDALIAEGRPRLGFLNPWLYSKGHRAFTDITWGSNRGCNTTGFSALAGWDASNRIRDPMVSRSEGIGSGLEV